MLPHQFRDNPPCQLGSSYGTRTMPLFPRQHNSPKRKGGDERVMSRQVDRESRGPQGERGLEFSRRKKGQTFFLSPHSLGLYNNNVSRLRTVSGLNLLLFKNVNYGVGLMRSLQPPDILWIHWRVYNFIVNTNKWVFFLPPSDAYIRSFLYLLYSLIKLYYTASSLAPD